MAEMYGSFINRIQENKQFCGTIEVGTGMTEYHYSDRDAYEVIEVIDQKHVFVRKYDHKKVGNLPMDNDWELVSNPDNPVYEMVYRYNGWYSVCSWTQADVDRIIARDGFFIDWHGVQDKLKKKPVVKVYNKMNVSFGIASYYYDYEF